MNSFRSLMAALTAAIMLSGTAHATLPTPTEGAPMPSLAPVVKRAEPAVVSIAVRGTIREQQQRNPLFDDPFFRRFFDVQPDTRPRERQFQSAGSGVIVDAKNGYILTNYHVVENGNDIAITLPDDRTFHAKVLGSDEAADVAVLRADVSELRRKNITLTAMALGDSSKLEVGDYVIAIGNPFGLQHTVTAGIVSALGRTGINPEAGGYESFIQTDASINPGNSGGALVNLRGELVGINSAIYSRSGGNIGIGFAIPVNMVKSVMEQLVKYGEVKHGVLGVQMYDITPEIADQYGLGDTAGALIGSVAPGSSAQRAGIKAGDLVTTVNGATIKSPAELRAAIGMAKIGDELELGLVRDGKTLKIPARIMDRRDVGTSGDGGIYRKLQGAAFADLPNDSGVLVKSVLAGSAAAQAGLRNNDVIIAVGRTPTPNTKVFNDSLRGATMLVLKVRRGGETFLIPIR